MNFKDEQPKPEPSKESKTRVSECGAYVIREDGSMTIKTGANKGKNISIMLVLSQGYDFEEIAGDDLHGCDQTFCKTTVLANYVAAFGYASLLKIVENGMDGIISSAALMDKFIRITATESLDLMENHKAHPIIAGLCLCLRLREAEMEFAREMTMGSLRERHGDKLDSILNTIKHAILMHKVQKDQKN